MRWLFTSPLFADEEQTQTARQLYVILWTIILALTLTVVVYTFILPQATWRWLSILGVVDTTCLVLLGLTRRRQMRLVSGLVVVILWGVVMALASTAGGIHAPSIYGYPLIVFIAGLLLGARISIITAVGCSLTGWGLVYAEWTGVLPPSAVQHNEFSLWLSLSLSLAIIVGLQYLATDAIKRSLQRARQELVERQKIEAALRESEERFRTLIEKAPVAIAISRELKFEYVNPKFLEMYGFESAEELRGQPISQRVASADRAKFTKRAHQREQNLPTETTYEAMALRKNGSEFSVMAAATRVNLAEGPATIGFFQDVTARNQAEKSQRETQQLYENIFRLSPEVIVVTTEKEGRYLAANDAHERVTGYRADEVIGHTVAEFEIWDSPTDRQKVLQCVREQGLVRNMEMRFRRRSGEPYAALYSAVPMEVSGKRCLVSMVTDITERKQAEEALRESEARLRQITDNMVDLIAQFDAQAHFQYVSPSYEKILGYRPEELLGQWAPDFIHPDEKDEMIQAIDAMLKAGTGSVQFRYRHKDGTYRWFESTGRNLLNAEGQMIGSIMGSRDITDRKQAEEALRESEERFKRIVENSHELISETDAQGKFVYFNPNVELTLGYSREELLGTLASDLVHPDDIQTAITGFAQLLERGTAMVVLRFRHKDGSWHWFECASRIYQTTNGEVRNAVFARDITDRKQVEEALRESEDKIRSIFENSLAGVALVGLDGRYLMVNPAFSRIFGYSPEEFLTIDFFRITHPDDMELSRKTMQNVINQRGERLWFTKRYIHRDGHTIWADVSSALVYGVDGEPSYFVTHIIDITERKRAEEALRESEEKYRLIAENATDVIWTADLTLKPVYISPSIEKLRGYTVEEAMQEPFEATLTPASLEHAGQTLQAALEREKMGIKESRLVEPIALEYTCKDGSTVWAESSITYMRDAAGQLLGFMGVTRNITERKQAEAELAATQALLRSSIEQSPAPMVVATPDGTVTIFNQACLEFLGIADETDIKPGINMFTMARSWQDLDTEGQPIPLHEAPLALALQGKATKGKEMKARRKDGTERWEVVDGVPIYDGEGKLIAGLIIFPDITQRKQAEEALRESERKLRLSEEQLRATLEYAPIGMATTDSTGKFLSANREFARMLHYSPEEFGRMTFVDITAPGDVDASRANTQALWRGDISSFQMEKKYLCKDGVVIDGFLSVAMVYDVGGQPLFAVAMVNDITERKQAEEELTIVKAMLEAAFEQTPIPMALVSMPDGVLRIANSAILEFLDVVDEPSPVGQPLTDLKPSYQDYDAQGNLTPLAEAPLALALQGQKTLNQERKIVTKNGTTRWALVNANPIYSAYGNIIAAYIIFPDITERRWAEEQIKTSLKEKEALIRELYHRTKNNMQVICAMLELQADYTQNEQVTQVFEEMGNRIRSMALVHQMLYQSQNLSSINLQAYISELADLLISSYSLSPRQVSLKLDLENVSILIDMAVPCGLILNELISNALKHAFPDDRPGEITIGLHQSSANIIELRVADNGVGVPAGFDFRKHGKMGLQSVFAIGEYQLQGEVKFEVNNGLVCFLRFSNTLYQARV